MRISFPLGMSEEAMAFEKENKDRILMWDSETNYTLSEKTIKFTLVDKTEHEFTFPFSKMII